MRCPMGCLTVAAAVGSGTTFGTILVVARRHKSSARIHATHCRQSYFFFFLHGPRGCSGSGGDSIALATVQNGSTGHDSRRPGWQVRQSAPLLCRLRTIDVRDRILNRSVRTRKLATFVLEYRCSLVDVGFFIL
jgi:hypothetical protein